MMKKNNSHYNFIQAASTRSGPERIGSLQLAAPVLQRLEDAGFEAFLVGGCVREALREFLAAERLASGNLPGVAAGMKATDIDVTTNALPEEICRVFADMPVIETGIKHGTVTVLAPGREPAGSRLPVEITTYRTDGTYSDGRHPDQVRFVTSLEKDLARRDFTVNAMAMDLRGDVIDPYGGREDLEKGIVRAVGDPDKRFREDGLRILRALRFAAVLTIEEGVQGYGNGPAGSEAATRGFRMDPATEAALFRCASLLRRISSERIFAEIKKLVCGPAAGDVIRRYADILTVVIPEMGPMKGFDQNNPYHRYDVLEHCIRAMEAVGTVSGIEEDPGAEPKRDLVPEPGTGPEPDPGKKSEPDPSPERKQMTYMKLAALFHDIGKPGVYTEDKNGIGHFYTHPQAGADIVLQILSRLRADRFTTDRITTLVRCHDLVFQEDDRLLKRWMNRYTPQILLEILELKRADNIATGNVSRELLDKFDRIEVRIRRLHKEAKAGESCISVNDLAIRGQDLIEAGIPEGPEIGRILRALLEAVIDEETVNERTALLEAAERMRDRGGK